MLQVLDFIITCITDFMKMLFTINLGNGFNLGLLMCICFIFLPMMIRVINFLKQDAIEELDDKYDETRPREFFTSAEHSTYNTENGRFSNTIYQTEGIRFRSRYRRGRPSIKRRVLK